MIGMYNIWQMLLLYPNNKLFKNRYDYIIVSNRNTNETYELYELCFLGCLRQTQ